MYSADKGEENRAPCYNVDWDFEKLYSEAVGRKEKKKIIISFKKKKKCSHYRAIARSVAEIMDFRNMRQKRLRDVPEVTAGYWQRKASLEEPKSCGYLASSLLLRAE